ncbi:MAG: hypothetical protein JW841_13620 [Deltaproteobacteria bacterium]|nr:hypothetical protein [Deltaproteobacteria bacterium]
MVDEAFLKRAKQRKERLVSNVAKSYAEAERWDLEYWQSLTPQARLSALMAIHRDIASVHPDAKIPVSRWRP